MVVKNSIRTHQGSALEFDVKDSTDVVHVKSSGAPPQMFRENIGVVVEGTMVNGGYFKSDRLMVSHSNEYRAPGERSSGRQERARAPHEIDGRPEGLR